MNRKTRRMIENWPMLPKGEMPPPGRVSHAIVRHDEWCDFLRGDGDCNCDPVTTIHVQPKEWAER
ncbi:hypothetical protein D3C83_196430 [compost metagenome]